MSILLVALSLKSPIRGVPIKYCIVYRRIQADVIVYIFANLHTTLLTEGNMLDKLTPGSERASET